MSGRARGASWSMSPSIRGNSRSNVCSFTTLASGSMIDPCCCARAGAEAATTVQIANAPSMMRIKAKRRMVILLPADHHGHFVLAECFHDLPIQFLMRAHELRGTPRLTSAPMTERPNISGEGRKLGRRQLGSAHWRHGSPVLARLRYANGDGVRDRSQATIAPQPFAAGEVGPLRRALAVRSVAARTGRTRDFAVVDALAEGNLVGCCARWSWQHSR